jgi:hypothetical protein
VIISELNLYRLEICSVVRHAVARLLELQSEGDIRVRMLDRIKLDDRIHSPRARGIAVGMALVMAGVVNPQLSNLPAA